MDRCGAPSSRPIKPACHYPHLLCRSVPRAVRPQQEPHSPLAALNIRYSSAVLQNDHRSKRQTISDTRLLVPYILVDLRLSMACQRDLVVCLAAAVLLVAATSQATDAPKCKSDLTLPTLLRQSLRTRVRNGVNEVIIIIIYLFTAIGLLPRWQWLFYM